jgi:hypothetical protein
LPNQDESAAVPGAAKKKRGGIMDTIRILVSHYVCLFVGAIIGYAIALLMSMSKRSDQQ